MLSYRHAFHAGNHADVLKHLVLVQLTQYLGQKEKPFWVVDTHAGAGAYALDSAQAGKLQEYRDGVARLWERKDLPPALAEYLAFVRRMNPTGGLKAYPGSPFFALWTLREQDRLRLFELHSKDARLLAGNFESAGKQVIVAPADGFAGLKAVLPPPTRRGLVLIDPSYEEKQDYDRVIRALKDALERFSGGVYALWYPQLTRIESHELPARLKRVSDKWLHVALRVRTPAKDGFGMHGSGMFVINPPWTLHETLAEVMPYLVSVLGTDAGAGYVLERSEDAGK
ncbi:23S rRNA (adenine(2030)-N(6))-methyltransferase RlmJ [Propionivibrio dicarboxylicus]|uniref:Ribosomal RNA large subunit methyltransferase J n=1 Tax=Propionivibrio dicarboxylicus TaxID=83767 RepID=A0A1G7ZG63_9RHOO|nr:23S rRNA (adenine(2030)-N(6))-methyltransferase RlmJ [Propionivibrio dicarboxylicus]SDH07732.1 23S rRNA (adenine2030-N6)-methyltransferase [Propionivibrio dicarboxylicus]